MKADTPPDARANDVREPDSVVPDHTLVLSKVSPAGWTLTVHETGELLATGIGFDPQAIVDIVDAYRRRGGFRARQMAGGERG